MKLFLRPFDTADIDDEFISWHQNDDGHLNFFTGSRRSFSHENLLEWIGHSKARDTHFYLISSDDGAKIGTIKIGPIDLVNKTSDLVCLIGNRDYLDGGLLRKRSLSATRLRSKSWIFAAFKVACTRAMLLRSRHTRALAGSLRAG